MNALTIWACEGAYKQTRGIIVSHAQHDSFICSLTSAVLSVKKSNLLHGKQHFFLCTSAKICIQRIVTLLQFFITEYLDALWTGQIQTLIFWGTIFCFWLGITWPSTPYFIVSCKKSSINYCGHAFIFSSFYFIYSPFTWIISFFPAVNFISIKYQICAQWGFANMECVGAWNRHEGQLLPLYNRTRSA